MRGNTLLVVIIFKLSVAGRTGEAPILLTKVDFLLGIA
jgi:hypothetical protein